MPVEETGVAAALETRSVSTAVDSDNPWPGLDAYDERGKDYFQGRGDVARDLLRLVLHEDLVLLYGISGLGKTSLLRAGLFPHLPPNILPVYLRLNYVTAGDSAAGTVTKPASFTDLVHQVVSKVRQTATDNGAEPPSRAPQPEKGLWEYFRRADDGFWNSRGLLMTPLLVFDQFEEMFTRVESPHAAQRHFEQFLTDLAYLISGHEPPWYEAVCGTDEALERPAYTRQPGVCKVLFSFREDYLANVKGLSRIIPSIDRIFVRLEPMTRKAATLAVSHAGGHLMGGGGVGSHLRTSIRIIRKVTLAPGRLGVSDTVDSALLSLFCKELNDKRKLRTPPIIERTLIESAEAGRIFESFYAGAMRAVSPVTQDFVERNLVLPGTRSRWPAAEQSALAAGVPKKDLDALAALRLIRFDVSAGIARFELTHDVLVDVVMESRAHREEEARIEKERKALESEAERTRHLLMEEWQHTKTIWSSAAAVVASLLLIVAAVALLNVIRLQRQQQARMFADAAYSELGQDVRLSASLARRALQRSRVPMPLAEITLNSALRSPFVRARHELPAPGPRIALSNDGAAVALVFVRDVSQSQQDVELQIRRGPDFAEARSLPLERSVFAVEFEGSSALFVIYSDTSVDRVDIGNGELRRSALVGQVPGGRFATSAVVSRDGRSVLVGSVSLVVPESDQLTSRPPPPAVSVFTVGTTRWRAVEIGNVGASLALSRDGTTHAALSSDGLLTITTSENRRGPYRVGVSPLLVLSDDGTRALTVCHESGVTSFRVLTATDGREWTAALPSGDFVTSAEFSPDGTSVAVAQADGVVSVWDVVNERAAFRVAEAFQFAFSQDSEELLTWSQSDTVERWNTRSGQRNERLGGHGDVVSMAASATTAAPIVTIAGKQLYLWARPEIDRVVRTEHETEPLLASVSPDGLRIATADAAAVHIYDVEAGTRQHTVLVQQPTALAFAPDSRQIAIGTAAGGLLFEPLNPASERNTQAAASSVQRLASSATTAPDVQGAVSALAFTASGHVAIASRAGSGDVSRVVLRIPGGGVQSLADNLPGTVVMLAATESRVAVGLSPPRYDARNARVSFRVLPVTGTTMATGLVRPSSPAPVSPPPGLRIDPAEVVKASPPLPLSRTYATGSGDDTQHCQLGLASINADWTLGATTTSCERTIGHWRDLQEPANFLYMERAVERIAVSPADDFVAVALVNGAVWMYHAAFPSRHVVLQGAGPQVRWLGFGGAGRNMRLFALRSDKTFARYAVTSSDLEVIADRRGSQWTLGREECDRVFAGLSGIGPCDEAGFWTVVKRTLMSAWPGR